MQTKTCSYDLYTVKSRFSYFVLMQTSYNTKSVVTDVILKLTTMIVRNEHTLNYQLGLHNKRRALLLSRRQRQWTYREPSGKIKQQQTN